MTAVDLHDLIAFIFSQQPVIHENAGQVVADGFVGQHGGDRGIHAARQRAEDLAVSDDFLDLADLGLRKTGHRPVLGAAAHIIEEIRQQLLAEGCVMHFRMELDAIQFLIRILHRRRRAIVRTGRDFKSGRRLLDIIRMTHPAFTGIEYTVKKEAVRRCDTNLDPAVFPEIRADDLAAEQMRHELGAVADPEHRNAHIEKLLRKRRSTFRVYTGRAAREDDALRLSLHDLIHAFRIRDDLAIHVCFPDSSCNQLVVLAAEINDQNSLIFHYRSPLYHAVN